MLINYIIKSGKIKMPIYEITPERIPNAIKPTVEKLAKAYQLVARGNADPRGKKLIALVEDAIAATMNCNSLLDQSSQIEELQRRLAALEAENAILRSEHQTAIALLQDTILEVSR